MEYDAAIRGEFENIHRELRLVELLLYKSEQNPLDDIEIRSELLGFLAFRHFVRHAYSFEIDPVAIVEILRKCPELVRSFRRKIEEVSR